jgi:7-cyano-7-deazaguanine synthase
MKRPLKVLVILSGGMDSTAMLAWAKESVIIGPRDEKDKKSRHKEFEVVGAINFQYGSKHNEREAVAFEQICKHYKIKGETVELPFINQLFKSDLLKSGGEVPEGHYADESMKQTVVPFRNGIMVAIAAGYAESIGADAVMLGNHMGDHAIYPDCRKEFIHRMADAVFHGTYSNTKVLSPFVDIDKTEIARIGAKNHAPFDLTYTCYKGGEKHCGKCGSCTERKEAFRLAGVSDPTVYE